MISFFIPDRITHKRDEFPMQSPDMDSNQKYKELFQKYSSGTLSQDEITQLKKLVAEMNDPLLDDQLQQLWNNYSAHGRNVKAFNEVSANLKRMIQPQKQRNIGFYLWRGVAAVLLPLLFIASVYLLLERRSFESRLNQEYTANTDRGERATITLPDGTKVYLNTQTSLTYPASFALNNRMVTLSGEAYFEVTHDKKNPFVVHTPELDIKVLGTSFNLYACSDDCWFEATLVDGKIEATPVQRPGNKVLLNPGQKVRYNTETGEMKVVNTDLRMETAWKRGDLMFRSENLQVVLKKLESFYGTQIRMEGIYPDELFTGSFHEDDINMVLTNLQTHYNFTYQKTGNHIIIKFK